MFLKYMVFRNVTSHTSSYFGMFGGVFRNVTESYRIFFGMISVTFRNAIKSLPIVTFGMLGGILYVFGMLKV